MKHRFALPVAAAVAFLIASPAQAGTIKIDFDLSNSIISILGGIITIPPDGSITSATASVTIQGTSVANPVAGAASMSGLSIAATVNAIAGGVATLTGNVTGTQVGTATGSLTGGLANLAISTLSLNLSALINCTPAGPCAILGTFPISVMSLTPITGIANLGVGGFGTFGNGTLNAILPITIAGNSAVITLVGQEVSRTFTPSVPEPGTFGMFGLGMLGLAGLGWRRSKN